MPACLLTLLLCVSACSGGDDPSGPAASPTLPAAPSLPTAEPGTVEQVAGRLGCTPTIRTEATELRQGMCKTADGEFAVTTFPAEKFKHTWLDAAAGWGGWYVVGPQWTISAATQDMAAAFRQKVGGSLVDGSVIPKQEGPAAP